ncbi:Uncharacterised protein [Candidatus Anstonella stagnisolia]|nr:Uncharacterised protein [Candidatus Anstonella stagnisolia]
MATVQQYESGHAPEWCTTLFAPPGGYGAKSVDGNYISR